jgi:hypothetical protein
MYLANRPPAHSQIPRRGAIAPPLLEQRYRRTALGLSQRTRRMQKVLPEEETEFLSPTSGEHFRFGAALWLFGERTQAP